MHNKAYNFSQVITGEQTLDQPRLYRIFVDRKPLVAFAGTLLSLLIGSCNSDLGFQGGIIPEQFGGVTSATAISPTSIQLNWNAYPGSTKYKVYVSDKNEAIFQPGFTSIIFQPSPRDANRTYQYAVTAVDSNTGQEVGSRTRYVGVRLLPNFNFQASGSAVAASKTSIRVNWQGNPSVTYKVFIAERMPTGTVSYNGFLSATANVVGASSTTISGLEEGHEYCAVVVAAYSDDTNDAPDGSSFTASIPSVLNSTAWTLGPSGTFGDSKLNAVQKCARTTSDFNITNMRVYAPKATLTSRPTFYVDIPGDATEDTAGTVETSIYQVSPSTGLATFVGKRTGTGRITASSNIASGRYKFFAILTDLVGAARAQDRKEIIVGPNGTTPSSVNDRPWVYIRSFDATESPSAPVGYYPNKQQAGLGSQKAGAAVAMGDFNCDGKSDLAMGVPESSVLSTDNRPAKQGKVIVYYDVSSGTPNATSRMQEIAFDITQFSGDAGRDLRLGTELIVGNFNKDNERTNQYGTSSEQIDFQCDDLAIGSGYGPLFILYGKRDVGSTFGGLNYTNATSYTSNPSSSCDSTTNMCSPAVFTGGDWRRKIGKSFSTGDFNGDGYLDLAASTGGSTGVSGQFINGGIMVFRGSEFGLIPPESFSDTAEIVNFPSGPRPGFPFIPRTATSFSPNPTPAPGWNDIGFGSAVGTLHNSYYDVKPTDLSKGTKRVRDILLVGVPGYANRGRVIACRPETDFAITPEPTFANDANTNLVWNCSRFINPPDRITGTGTTNLGLSFGSSLVGIANPLRYQPNQFIDVACGSADPNCSETSTKLGIPGAVAVGDPSSESVFVYYVPVNPGSNTTRDQLGQSRNTQVEKMFQQIRSTGAGDLSDDCTYNTTNNTTLCVETGDPCRTTLLDTGAPLGTGQEYCNIQRILHPTNAGGQFGAVVRALAGNNSPSGISAKDSILAVAAPARSVTLSGGVTYASVGSVQLFLQNSVNLTNPIVVRDPDSPRNCDTNDICRYSTGFSNSLTTALDYSGSLSENVQFGLGGIASGPIEYDPLGTQYSRINDIVVGAPGHAATVNSGSGTARVYDNGAAQLFFSHGGTYRSYRTIESGPTASSWHLIQRSFSQESDLKYHQATTAGDLNFDGVDDVMVRINSGSRNKLRVLFGRSDRVGFNTAPSSFQDIEVQGDLSGGRRFFPLGKITNGQFPAFWVTGQYQSYIYFAGIGGIIQGAPSAFGLGGTPRRFSAPSNFYFDATFGSDILYLNFADGFTPGAESSGNIDSTLNPTAAMARGDFNGDGYGDFAITLMSANQIADLSKTRGCIFNNCFGTSSGTYSTKVAIFYGGRDNGFQTQPNSSGGYPLSSAYFTDLSGDAATTSLFGAPCNSTTGANCRIQLIGEGTLASPLQEFGDVITSVPMGTCLVGGNNVPVNGLVVRAETSTSPGPALPRLYVYKPKCLGTAGDLSGLAVYNGERTLAVPAPSATSLGFANSMATAVKLNDSASGVVSHLVISDQTRRTIYSIPVNPIDALGVSFSSVNDTANGGRTIDYSTSNMMNGFGGVDAGFGETIADVGDINGDGFGDVAIGMSRLTRKEISTQFDGQGAIVVLFGSPNGLQSHSGTSFTTALDPSRDAFCFTRPGASVISSICNPTLLYLPQPTNSTRNGAAERIFLSRDSRLNFGALNENLGSFIMGVPGRDTLESLNSDRILNGGAFYALP